MEERKYYMKNIIIMRIFFTIFLLLFLGIIGYVVVSVVTDMIAQFDGFYIMVLVVAIFCLVAVTYFFRIVFLKVPMIEVNKEKLILRTKFLRKEVLIRDIIAVTEKKLFTNRVLEIIVRSNKKINVSLNQVECDLNDVVKDINDFIKLYRES